jgi:hypothetical protein
MPRGDIDVPNGVDALRAPDLLWERNTAWLELGLAIVYLVQKKVHVLKWRLGKANAFLGV